MKYLSFASRFKFSTHNFHKISNFDSEIDSLRESVKRFADERVAPLAHKTDF